MSADARAWDTLPLAPAWGLHAASYRRCHVLLLSERHVLLSGRPASTGCLILRREGHLRVSLPASGIHFVARKLPGGRGDAPPARSPFSESGSSAPSLLPASPQTNYELIKAVLMNQVSARTKRLVSGPGEEAGRGAGSPSPALRPRGPPAQGTRRT